MERRKLTKEDIDKVRDIEGFPIGTDEDIIALSDAPYYTACPNPFIEEFIKENGTPYDEETDDYHREPFAADVSEGKNDPIYNAHTYHTKVPHKAIMRYILYYTVPGDLVLDGFCGTGMTGVAANMCGNPDNDFKLLIEKEMNGVKWGKRIPILNDLSPIATLISRNYNKDVDINAFEHEAKKILLETKKECDWMFRTKHQQDTLSLFSEDGIINYTVWSDVFVCPHCGEEIIFYNAACDPKTGKVEEYFCCKKCGSLLKKKDCNKSLENVFDKATNGIKSFVKQKPVLINYQVGKKRYNKVPDGDDLEVINKIEKIQIPYWFPTNRMCEGKESRRNDKIGLTHVNDYFYKRTLFVLSSMFDKINNSELKDILTIWFTSQIINISKMNRYRPQVSFPYNPLSGTLYVSSLVCEANPFNAYDGKIKKFVDALNRNVLNKACISTGSTTDLPIQDNSIDYIFTDPPFGANLNYSELSFLWESWIGIITQNKYEAIVNPQMGKALLDYQYLMTDCFKEYYRVLKPNRWMTVEFHNSQNAVWRSIQEGLQRAGFIIADVRTLDKQGGSFKQVNASSAVKQDLIISVYKPKNSLKKVFELSAGNEKTAWSFVEQHLENLPIAVVTNNRIELIAERQGYLLFDRMIAYHIMNGLPVPIDANEFYVGLDTRFIKRDGMYFLPNQINEYDTARIKNEIEDIQLELFVTNEKSAIAWLYQQLDASNEGPQTYAELQPKFMMEVKTVDKFENIPELKVLLEENFLQDDKGKWYIPDRTKEADIAKLREKNLWKEFEGYMNSKGKLKLFRSEAIRTGFSRLWKDKNYHAIIEIAERLPEQTVQEDPNILMYYDISLSRI